MIIIQLKILLIGWLINNVDNPMMVYVGQFVSDVKTQTMFQA